MAIKSVELLFRGYSQTARINAQRFVEALGFADDPEVIQVIYDEGHQLGVRAVFARLSTEQFDVEYPDDALENEFATLLERLGHWLHAKEDRIGTMRRAGVEMDVFVDLWIDQDQVDLAFPAVLLRECGRQELTLKVVSND